MSQLAPATTSRLRGWPRSPLLVLVAAIASLGSACLADGEIVDADRTSAAAPAANRPAPSRASYAPVGDMLQAMCGSLDCHGQVGRNLRLYGARGLRFDPNDNAAENPTTPREYDESYWSVIGLEPEIIGQVVREAGAAPERLTLVRKARQLEKHKGGTLMMPGDARDRCLLSWLAGGIDAAACTVGKDVARPEAVPASP
jgi:hypothetical protein